MKTQIQKIGRQSLLPTGRDGVTSRAWYESRRGAFMMLAAVCLVGMIGFVALTVDLGVVSLTKTNLQKTADAAALAAAQEIIASVEAYHNGQHAGSGQDVNSISIEAAKEMARKVAELNGVFIDPDRDVSFGRRVFNGDEEKFEIAWGTPPYSSGDAFNVVGVNCRRDNVDQTKPDSVLKLFFAPIMGQKTAAVTASAVAFVESRDIVTVLDYSGSMSFDSQLRSVNAIGKQALENNMKDIYDALQPLNLGSMVFTPQWLKVEGEDPASPGEAKIFVTFKDTEAEVSSSHNLQEVLLVFENSATQTFSNLSGKTGTFKGTGWNNNRPIFAVWVKSGDSSVTLTGKAPTHPSHPQIELTFNGTSIFVQSDKHLSNVVLEYSDGVHQKFDGLSGYTGTFQGTGANTGKTIVTAWIKSGNNHSNDGPGYGDRFDNPGTGSAQPQYFEDNNHNVRKAFNLNNLPYPYASGSWNAYINYVRSSNQVRNAGYRKQYGGLTFVDYILSQQPRHHQTADLWKTPHYPFHAMKNGMTLFLDFLEDLEFGDHVGLVIYDSAARVETQLKDENGTVLADLGSTPISNNYAAVDLIQRRKQAGHYDIFTALGDGIREGTELLKTKRRHGSRPTLLIMTDGMANRSPNGWSLPSNWKWSDLTDYTGNGVANYTTNDRHKQYAFYQAKLAIDQGFTLHTMSVGALADRELMKAIAFAGKGEWVDVPGGTSIAEVEENMLAAFSRIAANVPPAKLLHSDSP